MKEGLLVLPQGEGQARKYLNVIGQETSMQFEDMNHDAMRRPYRRHIQRLEEMERILRYLFEELARVGCTVQKAQIDKFLKADGEKAYELNHVEGELQKLYLHWMQMMANDVRLTTERNHVAEEVELLSLATSMLSSEASGLDAPLVSRMLNAVAGVIVNEDQVRFARTVFRASRGNCFTHFSPIEKQMADPKTGAPVSKTIFVILFQGAEQSSLKEKILKVCSTFGVNTYSWPGSSGEAAGRLKEMRATLAEKSAALQNCEDFIRNEASELINIPAAGRSSKVEEWRLFCIKEKSIYATLNMFEGEMHLRANCWFAASEEQKILDALAKAKGNGEQAVLKSIDNSRKEPPTYIRTNEFTDVWQCVINTYGIPRYQEANPALFATVTFPFIFGMMYGDVGHGSLLACFGLFLCVKGKKLLDMEGGETLYWVRFLVLQLGIYATFAGFLYNDMFSVGLQLFDTRFEGPDEKGNYFPTWDIKNEGNGKGGPYPFGVDWAWHGATNELLFMNSMKMKLSVLFGVIQMTLGVFLRFGNAIYFKSFIDLFCECCPMLIFMVCFFGWMDFMVVYKWVYAMDAPPGIINSLICMAMGPSGVGQPDEFPLWEGTGGSMSSVDLSTISMKFAILAVPWLLIPKPIMLYIQHKASKKGSGVSPEEEMEASHGGGGHGHGGEFNFGEIIIHQIIETIEYVLGTVSHTASYLRIWALSLAHQQLSEVFFQKTLGMALAISPPFNGIALYMGFAVWFAITFAVLLGMDVLECFLHTLRLHWVEFDSKFFKADGYNFEPFSVRAAIKAQDA
jgi:V-type H+-transporting ATPase subunit a